jgi:hypothetical protein
MNVENFIPLNQLCTHYQVQFSFFSSLSEHGLIEIISIEQEPYIHEDKINDLEKMIRIHLELNVNIEGLDVVFNLLGKIDDLQSEIVGLKNRLRLYEN